LEFLVEQGSFEMLSPENFLNIFEHYFSRNLESTEHSYEALLEELPENLQGVYKEGFTLAGKYFKKILEEFRRKSDEIFPDELTNDDMKKIYLRVIGGVDGQIQLGKQMARIMNSGIEFGYREGIISENIYRMMKEFYNAFSEELPFLYNRLLIE